MTKLDAGERCVLRGSKQTLLLLDLASRVFAPFLVIGGIQRRIGKRKPVLTIAQHRNGFDQLLISLKSLNNKTVFGSQLFGS